MLPTRRPKQRGQAPSQAACNGTCATARARPRATLTCRVPSWRRTRSRARAMAPRTSAPRWTGPETRISSASPRRRGDLDGRAGSSPSASRRCSTMRYAEQLDARGQRARVPATSPRAAHPSRARRASSASRWATDGAGASAARRSHGAPRRSRACRPSVCAALGTRCRLTARAWSRSPDRGPRRTPRAPAGRAARAAARRARRTAGARSLGDLQRGPLVTQLGRSSAVRARSSGLMMRWRRTARPIAKTISTIGTASTTESEAGRRVTTSTAAASTWAAASPSRERRVARGCRTEIGQYAGQRQACAAPATQPKTRSWHLPSRRCR